MKKLRNLKIAYKLGLVGVVLGIPIAVLLFLFVDARNAQIDLTHREIAGVEYLKPLRRMFEHVPQHQATANILLRGDESAKEQLSRIARLVDRDGGAIDSVDRQFGNRLGTTDRWRALNQSWRGIKGSYEGMTAEESSAVHTKLMGDIVDLMRYVADQSGLSVDPGLGTRYLMEGIVVNLPAMAVNLGAMRGLAVGVAASQSLDFDTQVRLALLSSQIQRNSTLLRRGMGVAYEFNPALKPELSRTVQSGTSGAIDFVQLTEEEIIRADPVTANPQEFFAAGARAIAGTFAVYDKALQSLAQLLNARAARLHAELYTQLGFASLAILLAAGLVFLIKGTITGQIGAINAVFGKIGMGDFTARAPVTGSDELGSMTLALNATLDSTLGLIQSREERDRVQTSIEALLRDISGAAEGDLTKQAAVAGDITGAIAESFNTMIIELRRVISQVHDATLHVSSAANEIQLTTEHLAEGSENQSAQIVDTSSAIEEMAVSIQQVSENAGQAAQVAEDALQSALGGAEAVKKTVDGMNSIRAQVQETSKRIKRLGESSQEIGEIVQLIGDIADRTSILALNASIQAAMAGDAGRGFAVVAEEVERLAERAADSTKKIATLIQSIQSDTHEAVSAMENTTLEVVGGSTLAAEAGDRLARIEGVSKQLAELIQSISMASNQQARGSEAVAKSMSEISGVTQQTAAGAMQAAASISNLATLADDLRDSMGRFTLPARAG